MAARHYAQFLDAASGDQSAEDDLQFASTPARILRGRFRIGYIPRHDSAFTESRYLISVRTAVSQELAFYLAPDAGDTQVLVEHTIDGLYALRTPITFSAGQELTITFDAEAGQITVAGATTGDGTGNGVTELPWDYPDGLPFRLGGSLIFPDVCARGHVSLPYAVL